jgi:hypothetical protein
MQRRGGAVESWWRALAAQFFCTRGGSGGVAFVGDALVAWLAVALSCCRFGAMVVLAGRGMPTVPWWRGWCCMAGVRAAFPLPPMLDLAVLVLDLLRWGRQPWGCCGAGVEAQDNGVSMQTLLEAVVWCG